MYNSKWKLDLFDSAYTSLALSQEKGLVQFVNPITAKSFSRQENNISADTSSVRHDQRPLDFLDRSGNHVTESPSPTDSVADPVPSQHTPVRTKVISAWMFEQSPALIGRTITFRNYDKSNWARIKRLPIELLCDVYKTAWFQCCWLTYSFSEKK